LVREGEPVIYVIPFGSSGSIPLDDREITSCRLAIVPKRKRTVFYGVF
jgi:hypothetical protein